MMNNSAMDKVIKLMREEIRREVFEELSEFIEMLESDRDFLKKNKQQLPTHKIIQNYIDDLNEIIKNKED